jgi:type II secretory pathway pseudopilin PulG
MPKSHHIANGRGRGVPAGLIESAGGARGGTARPRAARGFTLLEAALATIIIGVGVLAVVEAQHSFLERNTYSTFGATATYLANELREMTRSFSRHDRFSGGLYFLDPADPATFDGWGPELGEDQVVDLDDLDDLDGAVFGDATGFPDGFTMTTRYEGPVNAFGEAIPQTLFDGTTEMVTVDGESVPVSMRGWTQIVSVEKVSPGDITATVADNADVRNGATILRPVDRYPVRVTVRVLRQPDVNSGPELMTTLSWVVMP